MDTKTLIDLFAGNSLEKSPFRLNKEETLKEMQRRAANIPELADLPDFAAQMRRSMEPLGINMEPVLELYSPTSENFLAVIESTEGMPIECVALTDAIKESFKEVETSMTDAAIVRYYKAHSAYFQWFLIDRFEKVTIEEQTASFVKNLLEHVERQKDKSEEIAATDAFTDHLLSALPKESDVKKMVDNLLATPLLQEKAPVESLDPEINNCLKSIRNIPEPTLYSECRGKISLFIEKHFDIVFRGDNADKSLDKVREFYICDNHASLGYRTLFSTFVDFFTTEESLVLVECATKEQLFQTRAHFHTLGMHTKAPIRGWDLEPRWEQSSEQSIYHNTLYHGLYEAIQNRQLSRKERFALIKEAMEAKKKRAESATVIDASFLESILERFPARTLKMIESIQSLESVKIDRTILIAGAAHLMKYMALPTEKDIAIFYAFLKTRNCVVLNPKGGSVIEAEEPFDSLVKAWGAESASYWLSFA